MLIPPWGHLLMNLTGVVLLALLAARMWQLRRARRDGTGGMSGAMTPALVILSLGRPRPSLRRGPRRLPRSEAPGDLEGTPDGATRLPDELRPDRARRYPDHAHALGRAPGDPQRGIGGRALAGQCPRMDAERGAPGRGRRRTALPGTGRRPLGPPGHGPPRCPGRRAPPTARAPHPAPALAPPPGRGARRGLGRRGRP